MSKRIYLGRDNSDLDRMQTHLPSSVQHCIVRRALPASARQLRHRARQAIKQGDLTKAIAMLERLIEHGNATAEDFNNRGLVYFWHGQQHQALLDFNCAIALNPELPAAYNNRANYYAALGARESAIADYDHTIDLNPFHVRARINRAVTLRELQHYDEALEGLDEALVFRQMTGEIYAERGRVYHLRGDWNCAMADYRQALKAMPMPTEETCSANHPPHWQRVMTWLSELSTAA